MASKTLMRTGTSLLSRASCAGLTPRVPISNARIWPSGNLPLHQKGAVLANSLTSEELFLRYPCGIPSIRFFLPNVIGNDGKRLEDGVLENLERDSVINHPCGQPSLEFILPDGNDSSDDKMILHPKRTYQPSTRRRKRKLGYLARKRSVGGRKVLARRIAKGRHRLSA